MDEDRIRDRAYAIWEREGCPDGRHDAHWEQARRELLDEDRPARPASAPHDLGPEDLLHPSGRNSGGA